MNIQTSQIKCDGCGLPASPEHIAERLSRLELATRFRPVHINVLFISAAPQPGPESDFYRPPESREFFDPFMEAVEIAVSGNKIDAGNDPHESRAASLVEFQRRGYYLAYLSECPLPTGDETINSDIPRFGATLVRRIRFNYKPKHIAILGATLKPLRAILEEAGISSTLLQFPDSSNLNDSASPAKFSAALARLATCGGGTV